MEEKADSVEDKAQKSTNKQSEIIQLNMQVEEKEKPAGL